MPDASIGKHLKAATTLRRLKDVDLAAMMDGKADYEDALKVLQTRLLCLQQAYLNQGLRAILAFEGWDAAGKGGAIRRLTQMLDPRFCKVWPIGAPNAVEREMPYLQRFWTRLPPPGTVAVFDRSWYGRVLVERVEGLIPRAAWERAYDEINAFESALHDDGIRIVKILLHISAEEQLARLTERLARPQKRWKLTLADFDSRQFRKAYIAAYEEMLERCGTAACPWHVIAGEHKWFGRIATLQAICDVLARDVDIAPPPVDPALRARALAAGVPENSLPDEDR